MGLYRVLLIVLLFLIIERSSYQCSYRAAGAARFIADEVIEYDPWRLDRGNCCRQA
jgi:hypothetical protein